MNQIYLDVRTIEEWQENHLDHALHIPIVELPERLNELDMNNEYLVFCGSRNRAGIAVNLLQSFGFKATNVGGITDLVKSNL